MKSATKIIGFSKREKQTVSIEQSFPRFYPWSISDCFEKKNSVSSHFLCKGLSYSQSCDGAWQMCVVMRHLPLCLQVWKYVKLLAQNGNLNDIILLVFIKLKLLR